MVFVRRWPLAVLSAAVFVSLGCGVGGDVPSRNAVSGRITLNGAPLESALVTFTPVRPDQAPTPAVARVIGGVFTIDAEFGPKAGKYKVSVSAPKPVARRGGRTVAPVDDEFDTTPMKESIPARYNARTELTADVTESGPNQFTFLVSSR